MHLLRWEARIQNPLVLNPARQGELETELRNMRAAHLQSHQALGVQKRDAILPAYQEQQDRVDNLKRQLIEAQSDQLDFYEQSVQDLSDWPDLQREVRNIRPVDDHTTRVIMATMRYIDTLIWIMYPMIFQCRGICGKH